jgi:hypothetical protein
MDIAILKAKHPTYYKTYLANVNDGPVLEVFEKHWQESFAFWSAITEGQSCFSYAAGKWTIKQILLHIIDTDRVFGYRVFALARSEKQELLSFDQDEYVDHSEADNRTWKEILAEYEAVKSANYLLLKGLSEKQWQGENNMAGQPISVLALAYVMPGHDLHHIAICKERYLKD